MEEMRKILSFVKQYSTAAPQGSSGWLKARRTIIGGSEVAAIMGLNPYSSFKKVLMSKLELAPFTGNTATRWGNLFEQAHEQYVQRIFDWPVQHTGSVDGVCRGHKYSPDGLVVGKVNGKNLVLLLEFKSPFSSWPGGRVPLHYMPQVQIGLADISMCDMGLFINAVFRRCARDQWTFEGGYTSNKEGEKKVEGPPLAMGVFFFSRSGGGQPQEVDYGVEPIDELLQQVSFKRVKATLFETFVFKRPAFAPEEYPLDEPADLEGWLDEAWKVHCEECAKEGRVPVGFMPWKMVAADVLLVERDEQLIKDAILHITAAADILEEIAGTHNPIGAYYAIDCPKTLLQQRIAEKRKALEGQEPVEEEQVHSSSSSVSSSASSGSSSSSSSGSSSDSNTVSSLSSTGSSSASSSAGSSSSNSSPL